MTGAAFFDLDKTVVARPSGLAFGRDFFRAGLITRGTLYRGLAAQTVYLMRGADEARMEQWRMRGLDLSRGQERAGFGRVIETFMTQVIRPIIYEEALELMEWHRSEGHAIFLVSSSPEEVVCPIGRMLGVDGVVATRSRVDEQGRYVGELEFYCYGPHKSEAMQTLARERGIDLAESWAYSDSITDLPMLETVGHAVAANPDRDLRHIAAQRGWAIRRFRRPVALRPLRRATATPGRKLAVASAVVMTLVGGLALRRRSPGRPGASLASEGEPP
ncbi:MAG: HAD-IB family hydrolase [Actinomycetota bacterium]